MSSPESKARAQTLTVVVPTYQEVANIPLLVRPPRAGPTAADRPPPRTAPPGTRVPTLASHNDLLAAFLFSMSFGVAMSTMADEYDTMEVRKAAINVHTRIADAIEAQNADLAFRRMEKHVSATRAITSAREDREIGT